MEKKIKLLDEYPLIVIPSIATAIGLNEAIVLQQIHYWIQKSKHYHDGYYWIYNSIPKWKEQFPFWSESTIKRTLSSLRKIGIVITGNYNRLKIDKTLWYRIDYDVLDSMNLPSVQNEPMDNVKMNLPLPETNTETNTDIIIRTLSSTFWTASKIPEPSPGGKGWNDWQDGLDALMKIKATPEEVTAAVKKLDDLGYGYTDPGSTVKTIVNMRKPQKAKKSKDNNRPLPKGL